MSYQRTKESEQKLTMTELASTEDGTGDVNFSVLSLETLIKTLRMSELSLSDHSKHKRKTED